MNKHWLNLHFKPNINVETTLGHRHWIDVILLTCFERCFVYVETMLIKQLSAQFSYSTRFQGWNNIGSSTLNRCNSIDVFANFETTSINVRPLSLIFNLISTLKQGWWKLTINVVSTLVQLWFVYQDFPMGKLFSNFLIDRCEIWEHLHSFREVNLCRVIPQL